MEAITMVDRIFEEETTLQSNIKMFEESGMIDGFSVQPIGKYKRLIGLSSLSLYTMKTKFSDAIEVQKTETKKAVETPVSTKKESKKLVSV